MTGQDQADNEHGKKESHRLIEALESSSCAGTLPPIEAKDTPSEQGSLPAKPRSCNNCNTLIPQARLRAMPNARYCVTCQEQVGDVIPASKPRRRVYCDADVSMDWFDSDNSRRPTISPENASIGVMRPSEYITD